MLNYLYLPLEDLLQGMLHRDINFLMVQKGRPNRSENVTVPHFQPHFSHFVEYVLKQKSPPGPQIFKQMMLDLKDIVDHLDEHFGPTAKDARSQIKSFLEEYNDSHQEDTVELSQFIESS